MSDIEQRISPPGWYLDPSGSGKRRWWNGLAWTNYVDGDLPPQGVVGGAIPQPLIPSNVTLNPWPIWLLVLLPFVAMAQGLTIDWSTMFRDFLAAAQSGSRLVPTLNAGLLLAQLVSVLSWVATIVFAFLDWRALKERGVVLPFHWAWSILMPLVYLIGRTVVLRRRAGRGQAPLWTYLLVYVVSTSVLAYQVTVSMLSAFAEITAMYPTT